MSAGILHRSECKCTSQQSARVDDDAIDLLEYCSCYWQVTVGYIIQKMAADSGHAQSPVSGDVNVSPRLPSTGFTWQNWQLFFHSPAGLSAF